MASCSGAVMTAGVVARIAICDMWLEGGVIPEEVKLKNLSRIELAIGVGLASREVGVGNTLEGHEAVEELFMGYRSYESAAMTCS